MLNYDAIEALVQVAREQSFVKAARTLAITQPALSQRIKTLETLVGVPMLVRSMPIRPTPIGQQLITHFHRVAELEHEVRGAWMGKKEKPAYLSVAVALNTESLSTWFIDALGTLLNEEHLLLELQIDDQERTDRWLRDGKVAGCVTSVPIAPSGCTSTSLGEMVYYLVCSPEFKRAHFQKGVNGRTLREAPAAIYGENDFMQRDYLQGQFRGYDKGNPVLHYVPSPQGIVEFAVRGYAFALLPWISIRRFLDDGTLVHLHREKPYRLKLFWICQDLQTEMTAKLSRRIIAGAQKVLHHR